MNVIAYIRISTKDQSNFSLTAQEEHVRNYAARNGYVILALFKDNGQSAKNFDRTEWKKLEAFVREHHSKVSFLVVPKYDRFSRDVAEALQMIDLLEKRYRILIISVFEPISLRPDSPYYFQFRTQMLMNAQVERMVIIERTKMGQHQAAKQGLVINNAPYGYEHYRNEKKQPTVRIDEEKAKVVVECFNLFLQGVSYTEIQIELKRRFGYQQYKKGAVQRMLSNPVYSGLIKVPAFMDEPEHYVNGIHEPIISPATWWQVQEMMQPKPKPKSILNPDFPLRGALHCDCGKLFTAANSSGKKSKIGYYFCNVHRGANYNSSRLHEQFNSLLTELSLSEVMINYLRQLTEKEMTRAISEQVSQLSEKQKIIHELTIKQENLQEKYISNEFSREEFLKWNSRFTAEKTILERELQEISIPIEMVWQHYHDSLHKLGNMRELFHAAELHQKQSLINQVFDGQLVYSNGHFRTPYLINIFHSKAASLQEKGLLVLEQPGDKKRSFKMLYPERNQNRTLNDFLSLISAIRVA